MAILLKIASVRVSSIHIIQVRVQNKGKSVWKSRYDGDVSTPPSLNPCLSSSNSVDKLKEKKKNARAPPPAPGGGGAPPLGRPPSLVAPLETSRLQLQLYIFAFGEKKIREKKSSRFTYGAAAKP